MSFPGFTALCVAVVDGVVGWGEILPAGQVLEGDLVGGFSIPTVTAAPLTAAPVTVAMGRSWRSRNDSEYPQRSECHTQHPFETHDCSCGVNKSEPPNVPHQQPNRIAAFTRPNPEPVQGKFTCVNSGFELRASRLRSPARPGPGDPATWSRSTRCGIVRVAAAPAPPTRRSLRRCPAYTTHRSRTRRRPVR